MKKWYQWLYLSLAFSVGAVVRYFDGKGLIASFIPVIGTALFAIIQFFCDRHGETGKKAFKYISIGLIVLLVIWLAYLIFG